MRSLANIFAGLSFILLILTLIFWFRSATWGDSLEWRHSPRQFNILSIDGLIGIGWGRISSPYPAPEGWTGSFWPFERKVHSIATDASFWNATWAGFYFNQHRRLTPTTSIDTRELRFPYWFMALTLVLLPLWKAVRFARNFRKESGTICVNCGYDVRAHRPGDKCPECGITIPGEDSATISGDQGDKNDYC